MTRPFAAAVLVALWIGAALITVAVVAPGAFAVLPTRALAGDMVGRVLPVLFAGALVVPALALVIAPSLRRSALGVAAPVVAALAAAAALWLVNPRIAALRATAVIPIDQLAPSDPRRAMFGVLHAISVALLGLATIAMAALLVPLARATVEHAPTSGDAR